MPSYPHKRDFARVPLRQTARLSKGPHVVGSRPLRDVGLGGVYIKGEGPLAVGETCRMEIEFAPGARILATARVLRVEPGLGAALEFTEMTLDCFDDLDRFVDAASHRVPS